MTAYANLCGEFNPTKLDKIKNLLHYLHSGTVISLRSAPAVKPAKRRAAGRSGIEWSSSAAPADPAGAKVPILLGQR